MNNMNPKSLKITYGAMLTAIFGMLLLANRQTGGMLEGFFIVLLPIPMVAYSARYGFRSGVPAFLSMLLISVLFGSFTTGFYAVTQAFLGMVLGGRLYRRCDINRTVLLVMSLSVVFNLLSTVVLASLFGYDVSRDVMEMQRMMRQLMAESGAVMPEGFLGFAYLRRLFILSMVLMGAIQGFLVYQLSLLLLRRLGMSVQKPKPAGEFFPPRWTGYLAFLLNMGYFMSYARELQQAALLEENPGLYQADPGRMIQLFGKSVDAAALFRSCLQTAGLAGYIYLLLFGMLALFMLIRACLVRNKLLSTALGFLSFFLLPQLVIFLGFAYISTELHQHLLNRLKEGTERREKGAP